MEKEKLGQEPALGFSYETKDFNNSYDPTSVPHKFNGMSKRLYIATQLMSGRIAADRTILDIVYTVKAIYEITDELLKQENL